jgi:hypothetical protein
LADDLLPKLHWKVQILELGVDLGPSVALRMLSVSATVIDIVIAIGNVIVVVPSPTRHSLCWVLGVGSWVLGVGCWC